MATPTIPDNYNGALQTPIASGYSAKTTSSELIKDIDLSGKIAIVTGGYAGIGLETVKTLVQAGAEVWVPARDIEKARQNLKAANIDEKPEKIIIHSMDLMNPASIDAFAQTFLKTHDRLDLLINNAGIMWVPLRRDSNGNESQFATNHLGHFQLTARLWPALKNSPNAARIITVSSYGHQIAPVDFEDPNFQHRPFETLQGYGQSKTANNLFTVELDHRAKKHGIRAYALHPGAVHGTDLGREASLELFQQMGLVDEKGNLFPEVEKRLKTIPQGAATTIWCATSPQLDTIGGVYCEDCEIANIDNGDIPHHYDQPSTLRGVKPYSLDAKNAQRLWSLTEKLTGIKFNLD